MCVVSERFRPDSLGKSIIKLWTNHILYHAIFSYFVYNKHVIYYVNGFFFCNIRDVVLRVKLCFQGRSDNIPTMVELRQVWYGCVDMSYQIVTELMRLLPRRTDDAIKQETRIRREGSKARNECTPLADHRPKWTFTERCILFELIYFNMN